MPFLYLNTSDPSKPSRDIPSEVFPMLPSPWLRCFHAPYVLSLDMDWIIQKINPLDPRPKSLVRRPTWKLTQQYKNMIAVKTERWTTNSLGTGSSGCPSLWEQVSCKCTRVNQTLTPVWKTGGSQFSGDEPRDLEMERVPISMGPPEPNQACRSQGVLFMFFAGKREQSQLLGPASPHDFPASSRKLEESAS